MQAGSPKHGAGEEPGGWSSSPPTQAGGLTTVLLVSGRWRWLHRVLFILLFVLPTLALMAVNITEYREESTLAVIRAKEQQALLAATIVNQKLSAQIDLGMSFATRPQLARSFEDGDWDAAKQVLDGVLDLYPEFDRVVLYDTAGIIRADMPAAGVVGESRASMAWFKVFAKLGKPFVSGVYWRLAEPKAQVVSLILPVRVPLRDGQVGMDRPVGILQMQLSLQGFADWLHMDVGRGGVIYVVDQYGRLVHHSGNASLRGRADYSSVGVVHKALATQSGVEIEADPEDGLPRMVAYQPVPKYGWGVVVAQPTDEAFAERDHSLKNTYVTYATLTLMALLLSLAILRILVLQKANEDRQRELAFLDELTGLNNRRGFMALSAMQMGAAARLQQQLFFVYADLNGMKQINDRFGHKEGDRALVDTAQILRSAFRDIDIKARIGGDEFVVLGTVREGFDAEIVRSRLRKATLTYVTENPRPYELSLSIGVVFYDPEAPCTLDELIERGDRLMYEIKAERHREAGALAI